MHGITQIAVRSRIDPSIHQPLMNITVHNQFSFGPRFRKRMFCAAIPLDRFGNVGIALSARYGGFFKGSDRLGGLFGLTRVSGADIYFGAKVRLRDTP